MASSSGVLHLRGVMAYISSNNHLSSLVEEPAVETHKSEDPESEWIAKYRAALNQRVIPQSRLVSIRGALESTWHRGISLLSKCTDTGYTYFKKGRATPQSGGMPHPQFLTPARKGSRPEANHKAAFEKSNVYHDKARRTG